MILNKDTALIELKKKVKLSGLKLTKQRESICRIFFEQTGHSSAEEILLEVRKSDPNVSLATVYRTLKILQEHNFATSHHFQDDQALFEPSFGSEDHHDHLICLKCKKIIEFFNAQIERLQDEVAKEHNFTVTDHKMELYGHCLDCAEK